MMSRESFKTRGPYRYGRKGWGPDGTLSTHLVSPNPNLRINRRRAQVALRERLAYANPPPGVMTVEEIRYWLNALLYQYGWQARSLERTLGVKIRATHIVEKAAGRSWIYRTEQLRFSRVLKRIISGELIHRPYVQIVGGCQLAEHPVPLPQPVRYEFDMKAGKMNRVLPRAWGTSTLPTFQGALKNAGRWRECTFPVEERKDFHERDK